MEWEKSQRKMSIDQEPKLNIRPDMLFVIGIKDAVTELAERLCAEVGLRVHFAMKNSDPSKRIDSLDEEAVIVPSLPEDERVFFCGLKASERLCDKEGGPLDCNWTDNDASAFAFPLMAYLHAAAEFRPPLPQGWRLKDIPQSPGTFESDSRYCQVGHFGPSGTVVADFGNGKQILQLPQTYSSVFPQIENKFF